MQTLFNGSLQGKRVQRVHTPAPIVTLLKELWGRIECDPCSSPDPDNLVDAKIRIMPPENGCKYATKVPTGEVDERGRFIYVDAPPGLDRWPLNTYVNPEFSDLEPWFRQFAESWEVAILAPARAHRKWFREHLRKAVIADLNPVKFVGHTQAFPSPLVLAYRGDHFRTFRHLVDSYGIGEARP